MSNGVLRFDAVLFDCDGVLVDSETITNSVLRDMLEERGWRLTLQECVDIFIGKTVMDQQARIEAHTGRPFTPDWLLEFRERRNAALQARVQAIPHIHQTVQRLHVATQGRIACASGADRFKI